MQDTPNEATGGGAGGEVTTNPDTGFDPSGGIQSKAIFMVAAAITVIMVLVLLVK